jgi:hypothetical protein
LVKQAIVLLQLIQYRKNIRNPLQGNAIHHEGRNQQFSVKNNQYCNPQQVNAKGTAAGFAAFLFCL